LSCVAYIGFGSNLGDRRRIFERALSALEETPCIDVTGFANLYETAPVGLTDGGGEFLNSVIRVETTLSAPEIMAAMGSIERRLGKPVSHRSDMSRAVDLDLLLYGDSRISVNGLEVPHPRMHERAFVLVPLSELAPDAVHPLAGRTVEELKNDLPDRDLDGVRVFRDGMEPDGMAAGRPRGAGMTTE
jgi:2-amino-4-hydroxy-6-hydroxymethyldihydropteridine diphosphokinase